MNYLGYILLALILYGFSRFGYSRYQIFRTKNSIKNLFISLYEDIENLDLRLIKEDYSTLNKRYLQTEENKSLYLDTALIQSWKVLEEDFLLFSKITEKLKVIKAVSENVTDELGMGHLNWLGEALDLYPQREYGNKHEDYIKYLNELYKLDQTARTELDQHKTKKIHQYNTVHA